MQSRPSFCCCHTPPGAANTRWYSHCEGMNRKSPQCPHTLLLLAHTQERLQRRLRRPLLAQRLHAGTHVRNTQHRVQLGSRRQGRCRATGKRLPLARGGLQPARRPWHSHCRATRKLVHSKLYGALPYKNGMAMSNFSCRKGSCYLIVWQSLEASSSQQVLDGKRSERQEEPRRATWVLPGKHSEGPHLHQCFQGPLRILRLQCSLLPARSANTAGGTAGRA